MSDWSEGYVKGIDYTYSYYSELNPLASKLALLRAGIEPCTASTGACCELGFGFGVSTNIHAAASPSEWWGTDFNPTQAGFARELGRAMGSGIHLFDQSFAEFCQREDLPEFDFIGLHGIWTWVSDENRRLIVDFVRRRLRVGGLLYISYNTHPGWAQIVPLRQLLIEHMETMSPPGSGVAHRIDSALEYVDALLETSPGYAAANPAAANRIKALKSQGRNYLAHEYFNRDWQPMLFSELARWLEPAKVDFACSALYSDHFDVFNLLPAQVEILNRIPDINFRQSARDFVINRQFRKDYWIKGPRRLGVLEQKAALNEHRVVLVSDPGEIVLKAGGSLTERDLPEAIYRPLIDLLADLKVHTLAELEVAMLKNGIAFGQTLEAIMVLIGKGNAASVQDDSIVEKALQTTKCLNRQIIERSPGSSHVTVLASPVTGGGISVQSFHLQMLLARQQGLNTPKQWSEFIQRNLAANEAGIVKPGGGLMSPQESLAALAKEGKTFAATVLPRLQQLKIAD
jgi:SAM-dependent methyltransferase